MTNCSVVDSPGCNSRFQVAVTTPEICFKIIRHLGEGMSHFERGLFRIVGMGRRFLECV